MIKRVLLAAIAATATFMPVSAEVQPGTRSLLETLDENGVLVTVNPKSCREGKAAGSYRWIGFQREMTLCIGHSFDANDHDTVRHETVHAIQHCINAARKTDVNTPIIDERLPYYKFIHEYLTEDEIEWIKSMYDEEHWLMELEAFAGAKAYTSSELEELFLEVCTLQQSFDG